MSFIRLSKTTFGIAVFAYIFIYFSWNRAFTFMFSDSICFV